MMVDNPMLAAEPDDDSSDEDDSGGVKKMINPMMTSDGGRNQSETSTAQMIKANEEEMTEDELADLTYTFQAADMNAAGVIDANEFSTMLHVMGAELGMDEVLEIISEAKTSFKTWKKMADEENVDKVKAIWAEYDTNGDDAMDLKEITAVIDKLKELGADPNPINKADMRDGELSFDEFMAWFLKQDGLPDEFASPSLTGGTSLASRKKNKGVVGKGLNAMLLPLSVGTKIASAGPLFLMHQSTKMMKNKDEGQMEDPLSEEYDAEKAAEQAMARKNQLIFAEFAFMMRAGTLKTHLSDNWKERAEDMRKLREAFDCADVDGDNQLELAEFEMVIVSMNPKLDVDPADIKKVWAVLNPKGQPWIPFERYVKGMLTVKADPELAKIIPMDVPNRFQLLSLLIDSPINKDQEKLIFDKLSGLEKMGIRVLEKMRKPIEKWEIKATLDQACTGKLHDLTTDQRKAVKKSHWWCMAQACFIGSFCTFWPGLIENYLVYTYETDGAKDAYWTCPGTIGREGIGQDGNEMLLESSVYYGWDPERNVDNELGLYPYPLDPIACAPGTCLTLPANISEYAAMNGTVSWGNRDYLPLAARTDQNKGSVGQLQANGDPEWSAAGEWTQLVDGVNPACPLIGDCHDYCSPLPGTFSPDEVDGTVWHDRNMDLLTFWVLNITGIVIGICFEIPLLMMTAVRSAVQVADSLDMRLTPLNADRAFVANMLVRAAFELGDDDGDVMGVDSGKETKRANAESSKLKNLLSVLFVKGKVVITGALFKQITARVAPYNVATWCKPYTGTMLATGMWDTMMCHVIMKNAEIRAFGVTTGVEVFNEIIDVYCPNYEGDPTSMSDRCKKQILRAIGVAIVKKGSMFPTLELLLRHAVNYLNMKTSKAVTSGGIIDDELAFVDDMEYLTLDEHRATLCCHMLCHVLDGTIGFAELTLWKQLLDKVENLYQVDRAKFDAFGAAEMREYIIYRCPRLTKAVSRVPVEDKELHLAGEDAKESNEMVELQDIASFVPRPEKVSTYDKSGIVPRVLCQKFRDMDTTPISCAMISACFDPEANKEFMVATLTPTALQSFFRNELIYKVTNVLTLQI